MTTSAYLYLDLAAELKLDRAVLAGACFGGWVAAEMAVRNTNRFAGLLLAAPLAIKVGGVLDRDITDMHAIPPRPSSCAWPGPTRRKVRSTIPRLPDTELAGIARGREALAVFGWKPYMHKPQAEAVAAPHRYPHSLALGRAGRHRRDQLWRGLEGGNSRCHHGNHSSPPATIRTGNSPRRSLPI